MNFSSADSPADAPPADAPPADAPPAEGAIMAPSLEAVTVPAYVAETPRVAWIRKVGKKQRESMTPAMFERLKKQSEQSVKRSKLAKKGGMLRKSNALCQTSFNTRLTEMSECVMPSAEMREMQSAQLSARMRVVQDVAQKARTPMALRAESSDDEEEEEQLAVLGAEMGLALRGAGDEQVSEIEEKNQASFMALLEQLKKEPKEEAECQEKFSLYEVYLETVEKTRCAAFDFWDEAEPDFPEGAKQEVRRMLKKIDSADNMGVDFVEGRWFVYDMTSKAGSNNGKIGQTLSMVKARLELLSREDEDCPICLESMQACGAEPHVFGCCHKCCGDCWIHWSASGGFCPLCRHKDFLSDIIHRESALQ